MPTQSSPICSLGTSGLQRGRPKQLPRPLRTWRSSSIKPGRWTPGWHLPNARQADAEAEVERLKARGLDPLLPVMRAHGVPGLIACLDGTISLEEAIRRGQADTRAYAKRQVTWFRHQMEGWQAVAPAAALGVARARLAG